MARKANAAAVPAAANPLHVHAAVLSDDCPPASCSSQSPFSFLSIGTHHRVLLTLHIADDRDPRRIGTPRWRRHWGGHYDGFRPREVAFGYALDIRLMAFARLAQEQRELADIGRQRNLLRLTSVHFERY